MQIDFSQKYLGIWHKDCDLQKFSWIKLNNSRSKHVWIPDKIEMLQKFILCEDAQYVIIGNGSNVVLDNCDVVIKMTGLNRINLMDHTCVIAEAGISNRLLINKCLNHRIGGFEFLSTIPGTIGGAVYMNAGAHQDCIANHLLWVEGIDKSTGEIVNINKDEIHFSYRNSSIKGKYIITKVALAANVANIDDSNAILIKMQNYIESVQPREFTLGSTFKNPSAGSAWSIINQLPRSDLESDCFKMSELHRNFAIHKPPYKGTVQEFSEFICGIQSKVCERYGIQLEFEVEFLPYEHYSDTIRRKCGRK